MVPRQPHRAGCARDAGLARGPDARALMPRYNQRGLPQAPVLARGVRSDSTDIALVD